MIALILLLGGALCLNKHKLLCASCKAVSTEMLALLQGSRREMDIDHFLDGLCREERFGNYEFPPPDMFMGCQRFLAKHEEDLAAALARRADDAGFPEEFCAGNCRAEGVGEDSAESEINPYETYTVIHEDM